MRVPKRGALVRTAATPREAAEPIAEADILYAWKFPPQLYAKAGRLKWLQVMGAGVDWALVPELPAGVQVTRAPGIFGPWMAEYVVAWCSWVTQKMRVYRDAQRQRRWLDHVLPDRLAGKTLTIVGLGDIGRDMGRALGEADFVVVLLPLTPDTRGIIGAGVLDAMKPSAWLINIARGAVVDETALLGALDRKQIAGAVLDV